MTTATIDNKIEVGRNASGLVSLVLVLAAAGLAVGLYLAFLGLGTQGHAAFNTTSNGVVWGLPISTYVFFVLTSTGLTFVASLALIFGFKEFYPIAKRCVWLAFAMLISGFAVLALELGHPFRMLWVLPFSFQIQSAMFWMGLFYTLDLVFMLWKFGKMQKGDWDSKLSRQLGVASLIAVVLASGCLGLIFGMMSMRPAWFGGLTPVYFLTTAALTGGALAIMNTYLAHGFSQANMSPRLRAMMTGPAPKVFAAVLAVTLLFCLGRSITGMWAYQDGLQVFGQITSTPLFHVQLWGGLVIPLVLMLTPSLRGQTGAQMLAALLAFIGMFIAHYHFVIAGQLVPMFKGSWVPGFVQYTPSATEWSLVLVGFSLAFLVYAIGEKMFSLSALPGEQT
jgi:Ni/Fe-hydrogenase subunit HybB-like protein